MTTLDFNHPPSEPLAMMRQWLDDAGRETTLPNPNAMTLATIDPDGRPSARIVLARGLDERGIAFFSHYNGRKGRALEAHPQAALIFHWDDLERQLRVEGTVTRASAEESDAYWNTRPRGSQIGAWASSQSEPVASRAQLEKQLDHYTREFEGRDVPRPEYWGGFRVALDHVEFWAGRPARIHDRLVYTRTDDGWSIERLSP